MNSELAQQLESLLDADVNRKNVAANAAQERINQTAKNLADFESKKDAVIRPALKEIVTRYESKGMFCRVTERAEQERREGGIELPQIGLDLAGPEYRDQAMKPVFLISFDKQSREVSLYTSTGSQAGPGPKAKLDDVTADWVHTEFLNYKSPRIPIGKPVTFGKIQTRY